MTALVPVAETLPDDISRLPVLDWRNIQRKIWALADWWQSSGLADLGAMLVERERIRQRQRITAAKQRARIVTRAKGVQRKGRAV